MKKILIVFCLILPLYAHVQVETKLSQLFVRGKMFSTAIIEDAYFRNASIGFEYLLFDKHAVGIDYIHFRWRYEHDSTANGIEYGAGPSIYSRRNYLNIDYRFYPFNRHENLNIKPYFNSFIKIGKREVWSDDSTLTFFDEKKELYSHSSNFTDLGLAIGIRTYFGDKQRLGLDFNLGCVKRYSQIWQQRSRSVNPIGTLEEFNVLDTTWKIHMRLNLFFRIF